MTATPATKTLATKHVAGYVTDEGVAIPPHALHRFEDAHGKGGCWYSTVERAETSWARWIEGAPGRERRAAESARLAAAVAAHDARESDADPFARL
jgi:hypothetical protein